MHLLPGVAIQPNLELKTQPKQLLGSLPLVIVLPSYSIWFSLFLSVIYKFEGHPQLYQKSLMECEIKALIS
jgi:hypothetical protein